MSCRKSGGCLPCNGAGRRAGISFDYVVVGAGAAGCQVAERLSRDPRNQVLLMDAGFDQSDNPLINGVPDVQNYPFKQFYKDFGQSTDSLPNPAQGFQTSRFWESIVLGGGSTINGYLWTRGDRAAYDYWKDALGLDQWGYDQVLPFLKEIERNEAATSDAAQRGANGNTVITNAPNVPQTVTDAVLNAMSSVYGVPRAEDYNLESNQVAARGQVNVAQYSKQIPPRLVRGQHCEHGRRQSAQLDCAATRQRVEVARGAALKRVRPRALDRVVQASAAAGAL